MATRIVFVTQQVDPGHPTLAATVPKIRALAGLVDEVAVLADGAVEDVLPANCRVRTFRARYKAGRGLRFEAALVRELPGLRGGAVVAHMCPIYAVLAAPLVRSLRIPLVLWFTHWRASRLLAAAERLSSAVTSVDERSFPLDSKKVRAIGHGIDLSEFTCTPSLSAGTRPRRGSTSSCAPWRRSARTSGWTFTGRLSPQRSERIGRSSSNLRPGFRWKGGSCSEMRSHAPKFQDSS
jgi:hypothetical protein